MIELPSLILFHLCNDTGSCTLAPTKPSPVNLVNPVKDKVLVNVLIHGHIKVSINGQLVSRLFDI